jgi:acyl-coenzyme A thioesterase PaaI-like protein
VTNFSQDSRFTPGGSPGFARMLDALRVLQDTTSGIDLPDDVAEQARRDLEQLNRRLAPYAVPGDVHASGRVAGVPGRAQPLLPVFHLDEIDETRLAGRVTFGRYYLGGWGAVHGGAIPLMFDEVMGRLSNTGGRPAARTAYLHVNYRNVTPINTELRVEVRFGTEQGRKRYLLGTLHDGETVTADAEGLFVTLLPGQR